jgi:hypothetical protein
MTPRSSHLRGSRTRNEGESQMTQRGQHVRSMAGAHPRVILSNGDITDGMRSVLDAPMSTNQHEHAVWTGFGRGQGRHQGHHVLAGCAGGANGDGSGPCSDVLTQRPVFHRSVHLGTDAETSLFHTPTWEIERGILEKAGMGIGNRGGQVGLHCRLMVCDGEKRCATQRSDPWHELLVGVTRIGRADPPAQRHTGEKGLCDRDLVGLLRSRDVEERVLALRRAEGKHMGSRMLGGSASAHGFAIQSHRVLWNCHQRSADPVCESPFDVLCIYTRQECPGARIAGAENTARPEQVREHVALISAPAPNGQCRVTVTKQRCHQAGQEKGQYRASSMRGARIRNGGKTFRDPLQGLVLESVVTLIARH